MDAPAAAVMAALLLFSINKPVLPVGGPLAQLITPPCEEM